MVATFLQIIAGACATTIAYGSSDFSASISPLKTLRSSLSPFLVEPSLRLPHLRSRQGESMTSDAVNSSNNILLALLCDLPKYIPNSDGIFSAESVSLFSQLCEPRPNDRFKLENADMWAYFASRPIVGPFLRASDTIPAAPETLTALIPFQLPVSAQLFQFPKNPLLRTVSSEVVELGEKPSSAILEATDNRISPDIIANFLRASQEPGSATFFSSLEKSSVLPMLDVYAPAIRVWMEHSPAIREQVEEVLELLAAADPSLGKTARNRLFGPEDLSSTLPSYLRDDDTQINPLGSFLSSLSSSLKTQNEDRLTETFTNVPEQQHLEDPFAAFFSIPNNPFQEINHLDQMAAMLALLNRADELQRSDTTLPPTFSRPSAPQVVVTLSGNPEAINSNIEASASNLAIESSAASTEQPEIRSMERTRENVAEIGPASFSTDEEQVLAQIPAPIPAQIPAHNTEGTFEGEAQTTLRFDVVRPRIISARPVAGDDVLDAYKQHVITADSVPVIARQVEQLVQDKLPTPQSVGHNLALPLLVPAEQLLGKPLFQEQHLPEQDYVAEKFVGTAEVSSETPPSVAETEVERAAGIEDHGSKLVTSEDTTSALSQPELVPVSPAKEMSPVLGRMADAWKDQWRDDAVTQLLESLFGGGKSESSNRAQFKIEGVRAGLGDDEEPVPSYTLESVSKDDKYWDEVLGLVTSLAKTPVGWAR